MRRAIVLFTVVAALAGDRAMASLPFPLPSLSAASAVAKERDGAAAAIAASDWIRAERHLRAALAIFPDSHASAYELAVVLAHQQRRAEALGVLMTIAGKANLSIPQLFMDPDLAPLRADPGFDAVVRLVRQRALTPEPPATELPSSREEMEAISKADRDRLASVAMAFDPAQLALGEAAVLRLRSAVLASLAARATSGERAALAWAAVQELVLPDLMPRSELIAAEIVALQHESVATEHAVQLAFAVASARWVVGAMTSPSGAGDEQAASRYRTDLLEIAAGASDEPALQPVLIRLAALSGADLGLASRIHRRLMRLAKEPDAARAAMRAAAPGAVLAVEGMPALDLLLADGRRVTSDSWTGRFTLLHLWATWCPPCVSELPRVAEAVAEFEARGLTTLGIALEDEEGATLESFREDCRRLKVTWPQILDANLGESSPSHALGVTTIPQLILIGPDGTVLAASGRIGDIVPTLESRLAKKSPQPR